MKLGLATPAILLGTLATTSAAPLWMQDELTKRADNDLQVLQFAGFVETLESGFYQQLVKKFKAADYAAAGFTKNSAIVEEQMAGIAARELAHQQFVASAIKSNGAAVFGETCKYDYSSALKDPKTALATAQALEITGTGGIAGGILTQLQDKSLLSAAAQIVPVEARHNSILNTFNNALYTPNAFEISITRADVLSIAQGFVVPGSCDIPSGLGVTPQTALSITPASGSTFVGGSQLITSVGGKQIIDESIWCAIAIGGQSNAIVQPSSACYLPNPFAGPAFVYLIKGNETFTQDVNKRDPSLIYAGPNVVIVEVADKLSELVDQ